jgi:hypothetical protein
MLNKQDLSFPEVAILRKGKPKKIMKKKYGDTVKEIEIMGEDLGQKMRLHFLPGADAAKAAFQAAQDQHASKKESFAQLVTYSDNYVIRQGYEFERINAVVPATNVWAAWEYGNEVYMAGRRLGLADDDHYIYLRDPLNGNNFLVKDGEPFKKFEPKELIHYERDGKAYDLQVKTHGRLRLVLTDLMGMGQLVQVTLKTTSYYDCLNIKSQLAGIQAIADIVNGGNAGGVIFTIYRSQQNVTWNKPDGGAMRVDKWFFNIQADPEWVKKAFARMSQHALTGEVLAKALLPETSVSGPVDPEQEEMDPEGEFVPPDAEGVFDAQANPEPEEASASKSPAPKVARFSFSDARIVAIFAKQWNVEVGQAAKTLHEQHTAKRIPDTMTEAQAAELALGEKKP